METSRQSLCYRPRPESQQHRRIKEVVQEIYRIDPGAGTRTTATMASAITGMTVGRARARTVRDELHHWPMLHKPKGCTRPNRAAKPSPNLIADIKKTIEPGQVYVADITYLTVGQGFMYMVSFLDFASRFQLSWRMSNTQQPSCAAMPWPTHWRCIQSRRMSTATRAASSFPRNSSGFWPGRAFPRA